MRSTTIVAAAVLAASCASPAGSSTGTSADAIEPAKAANGLPCDVDAVLKSRCQACHGAQLMAGATVSLTSWDNLHADRKGKKVFELVKERIHDEARPMPPSPRLAAADLEALDEWLDRGAKKSSESCGGNPASPSRVEPLACDEGEKSVLKAASPFVMKEGAKLDQYMCFGVDVERDKKHHLIGFGPKVDNAKILHHILVFQADKSVDPDPAPCAPTSAAGWTMIGGWAPGGGNKMMPPEAGFPEEQGTTHYAVQLHYNNALALSGAKDQSGMELCATDKLRPNDAGIVAFGAMNIGAKKAISIPPRTPEHTVTCDYTWRHDDVKFFSASPHMHKRGRSLKSATLGDGGRVLADQPRFDFEQQVGSKIDVTLKKDEVVRTWCTWANPDDKTVTWGEGTDDEMCFNFLGYYPKSTSVTTWVQPALSATCTTE